MKIKIKKVRNNAIIPKYAHSNDSGADLFVANIQKINTGTGKLEDVKSEEYIISPFETILCQIGIILIPPKGIDIEVRPTSGNSLKTPLRIPNSPATIDNGFRGELGVIIQNVSNKEYTIKNGDKIAQMLIHRYEQADFCEVSNINETDRGASGFGSTGIAGQEQ